MKHTTGKIVRRYQCKILYIVGLSAGGILLVITCTKFRISFSCGLVYKLQSYLYFCVGVKLGVFLRKEHILKALNNMVLKRVFGNTESIKDDGLQYIFSTDYLLLLV
jgi:hypothetical protein